MSDGMGIYCGSGRDRIWGENTATPLFFSSIYVILFAERYSKETASDDNVLSLLMEVIT